MNSFEKLGLSQPLVDAVSKIGFIHPTPIQKKAIPQLLSGDIDFVGLAQTGTGKTAAFGLPLLELVNAKKKHTQALVLAPTRELCLQITRELMQFGQQLPGLYIRAVYGGADIKKQMKEIRQGAHIIVATPGRLRDLMRRKVVKIDQIDFVILDEADEMLNMGFKEEIDEILRDTPEEKNTWLFSATMPNDVRRIANTYMADPIELSIGQKNFGNEAIDHQYLIARSKEKFDILKRFLDFDAHLFGLVFCRTRRDCKRLADALIKEGYRADALSGDLSQSQRDRVMDRFRAGGLQVLIATDVAARGIDVQDITHVFHYNVPEDFAFYTHRSGRTARAGRTGISLVLLHPKDTELLRRMSRKLKLQFTKARIPTGREICQQRLTDELARICDMEVSPEVKAFLPMIADSFKDISKEELVARIASVSFSRYLKKYQDADRPGSRGKQVQATANGKEMKSCRLFINVGKMDVKGKAELIDLLCNRAGIKRSTIGSIDMQERQSYFEIESSKMKQLIVGFRKFRFQGRELRVNDAAGGAYRKKDRKKKGGNFKKFKKRQRHKSYR